MIVEKISDILEVVPKEVSSDSLLHTGDILLYIGRDTISSAMPDLCYGMKDLYEIGTLQRLLKSMGFYTGSIDESFGGLTKKAVEKFQDFYHINVNDRGTVGKKTWNKLLKGV